jgi:hypothetical protein
VIFYMKLSKTIIALAVVALLVGVAAAVYVMNAPASPTVTVNPSPSPSPSPSPVPAASLSQVQVSDTDIVVGDELTLSTTVSDHTEGIVVTFKIQADNTVVGTATTGPTGTATLTITANTAGTYNFIATATHP